MSNREIGAAGVLAYVALFWTGMAGVAVWATSNAAPTAPELAWMDGDEADTLKKLKIEIARESQDADGHDVSYTYAWYVNGELSEGKITDSLPPKETRKGDVWKVVVTPDDGTLNGWGCSWPWRECAGAVVAEKEMTIGNALPRGRARVVKTDGEDFEDGPDPKKDDIMLLFTCSDPDLNDIERDARKAAKEAGVDYVKPEEDPCTYEVDWFKVEYDENGERVERKQPAEGEERVRSEYTDKVLPKRTAKAGETWEIDIIAHDGDDAGDLVTEVYSFAE